MAKDRFNSATSGGSPPRTVPRIIGETFLVVFFAATVWGIAWELGYARAGRIVAIVIGVAGAPVLELTRLLQSRK